jgi:ribosome-binding factor A
MPKHNSRVQRVAREIQRELAVLIREEVKDPRVGMITLTDVEVSQDYAHAKVFYTSLAGDAAPETARGLKHAAPFLRSQLSQRLKLRVVPDLRFVYDSSVEGGMRLSQLIDEAVASDRSRGESSDETT